MITLTWGEIDRQEAGGGAPGLGERSGEFLIDRVWEDEKSSGMRWW